MVAGEQAKIGLQKSLELNSAVVVAEETVTWLGGFLTQSDSGRVVLNKADLTRCRQVTKLVPWH